MAYRSDPKFFTDAEKLYLEGRYQEAYELLTEVGLAYPNELQRIYEWRFDIAARVGKPEIAEAIFKEALDSGFFYSERTLRTDDDLQVMQGRPEFESLIKRDLEILAEAQKQAMPYLEVLYQGRDTALGKALLIALHGNNSNVEKFRQYWGGLWNTEWMVALPQSSQVSGKGNYVWNDMAVVERELRDHYASLCMGSKINAARVIISGFSKGGYAALDAAVRGYLPAKGFLAIAPYIGDLEAMLPLLDNIQNKHLRGYIIAGAKDESCVEGAIRLHDEMKKRSLCCELKIYPEMAHDFPDDFDVVLPEVLSFLLGGMEK